MSGSSTSRLTLDSTFGGPLVAINHISVLRFSCQHVLLPAHRTYHIDALGGKPSFPPP